MTHVYDSQFSGIVSTIISCLLKTEPRTLRRHQAFVWPAIKSIFAHPSGYITRVFLSANQNCHTLSTLEALEYAQFPDRKIQDIQNSKIAISPLV